MEGLGVCSSIFKWVCLNMGPLNPSVNQHVPLFSGHFEAMPPCSNPNHPRPWRTQRFSRFPKDAIIARAQTSRRAAVLGGGLLGLEAAKALMELGMAPRQGTIGKVDDKVWLVGNVH